MVEVRNQTSSEGCQWVVLERGRDDVNVDKAATGSGATLMKQEERARLFSLQLFHLILTPGLSPIRLSSNATATMISLLQPRDGDLPCQLISDAQFLYLIKTTTSLAIPSICFSYYLLSTI
jgi:hypothetical protein